MIGGRSSPSATPGVPPPQTKGRVLVVDDELVVARMYARMLSGAHEITVATDGLSAADLVASQDFDVVLSDVMMPGMDGLDLLRVVRQRDPHVSVLIVTGTPSPEGTGRAAAEGALLYLSKPVDLNALREAVSYGVHLRRAARSRAPA
jgi:CheY-like chemotaxis protein